MTVTATINGNCLITANPMSFGVYDPVSANATSPLPGQTTIAVTCTLGDETTVTLGQGNNPFSGSTDAAPSRQMVATVNATSYFLKYSLTQDSGGNTTWGNTSGTGEGYLGTGSAGSLTVYGAVAPGQNSLPAGTYSDSVVATITF
jgi:spore coat protein U-like protein